MEINQLMKLEIGNLHSPEFLISNFQKCNQLNMCKL